MTKPITTVFKAAVLLGAVAFAGSAGAQEFKLRWGHYLPNTAFVQVEKDFAEAVKQRTGGRVEIDITFAGGLGKGNELMTLAGRGAIDMASVVPGYYPDQLLYWKAYQIPFIFETPRQAMEIAAQAYKDLPVFQEELDKYNVKFLFHQPLGSYYMTGPDENCDTVEGLAGKKIRSFGADIPKIFEAVGAVPVSVGFGDIYEAVQRGTLDYSFINRGNINAIKVYEVGKFSCGPVMSIVGHLITIGQKTWDSLPADIQAIMVEEAEKAGKAYIDDIEIAEAAAGEAMMAQGAVIKPLKDGEMAKWRAAAPDMMQSWVDGLTETGDGDRAKEVADYWRSKIGG
ncbi:MAG TPA: TRAP transporter substrate-binding protein DctP [Thermohalobaculum sp.]|nr:TRAP transporter substrate-binding protein DctP [Thermohalobaculum sp.]